MSALQSFDLEIKTGGIFFEILETFKDNQSS